MIKNTKKRLESDKTGSALIMTVVLTVMLAIVAVLFVAVARMDMASTGNIADNKMLESSVKSIIELINRQLVLDTPGVPGQEYYDYPDANDTWLASIEPYLSVSNKAPDDANCGIYRWRQISDVTGYLRNKGFETQDVNVRPSGSTVIKDYPVLTPGGLADADGDGIADSKWFELTNMRSSKGKPIYAAVRIIDNSAMVNINTAHTFNPNSADANKIDGSGQMQVNLANLLKGTDSIDNLHNARCGTAPSDGNSYSKNVIWRYGLPNGNYFPFDISDELELRYRYCIDSKFISRFEVNCPQTAKGAGTANFGSLYNTDTSNEPENPCASNWRLRDWQRRITLPDDCKADRRHLLTSLNLDRIIDPAGSKMTNINTADVNDIYAAIRRGILDANENFPDANKVAAQIAVNIIDYRDSDSNVTDFNVGTTHYYGFERPCVYISELAHRGSSDGNSYAIELYKPYPEDEDANGWKLFVGGNPYDISWSGKKQFYVIAWQNPACLLTIDSTNASVQNKGSPVSPIFHINDEILLTRNVDGNNIVVDSKVVPNWLVADGNNSYQRDITPAKCIRRSWDSNDRVPTLGRVNDYNTNADANFIQAHPADSNFTNIGQIGMIFRKAAYYKVGDSNNGVIGYNGINKTEPEVRLNLADPNFQKIFKYLTVIDPNNFYPNDPNYASETRVKGRININTAPAYVIAQLPWVSLRKNPVGYNDPNLAKAIIAYRDKTKIPCGEPNDYGTRTDPCGFRSIGELCNVNLGSDPNFGINYYSRDYAVDGITPIDQAGFPDLTTPTPATGDGAANDFEERDLIFARISNLVTVRSDIFTAYILVRIGVDGPQKRCITILDRSGVKDPNGRVYIRAFQTTPEAR